MNGKQLKNSILQWAIQGKLVPQDANDEPAIELLKRINPKVKPIAEDVPFEVPKSWVWCRMGDIAFVTKLAGFEYTEHIANNLKSSGVPLFKGKNVQDGKIIYKFESYIPESLSDELGRSQIRKKCLLTPYVGTIGNIGLHNKQGKFHLGSNVGKIELLNPENETYIHEEYVHFYLRSSYGYSELTKFKKATAQESISIQAIREVYIPIPPTNEQKRIVAKIEEMMPLVERYGKAQEGLDKLNAGIKGKLRASILQEAIQGKLVPQDTNDEPAIELLKRINPKFVQPECEEDLPQGWCWCKPLDLGKFGMGQTILKKDMNVEGLPVYSATRNDEPLGYIIKEKNKIKLTSGDLVIPARGSIGYVTYVKDDDATCTQTTIYVKVVDKQISWYLYYYFHACRTTIFRHNGVAIPQVTIGMIYKHYIPIPPLAEQKRIVAKIEELFGVLGRL